MTSHQRDASQNYNQISPHTREAGTHPKEQEKTVLSKLLGVRNPPLLMVGVLTSAALLENNLDTPPNTRI